MNIFASLLSKVVGLFFWLMPPFVRWGWARFMAWLWFDALRIRRFTVLRNLTIAFPDLSKEQKLTIARQSMRNLCYNFVEICLLPFESNKTISDKTRFYGLEHFNEALLAKKGVLILSQHVGNGDVGVVRLVNQKIFFNLISKKFKNKLANDFWFGIREKMGVKFIEPHGNSTAFDILKCLKQNQPVAFVLDQFMSIPYGIETEFFGRKTGTAYGLALFAIRTGAPVVPVHVYRDSDFITHVVFEKPLPLIENPDKDTQIKLLTQSYNDKIEAIVRQYPDQWMWVHRRWKVFG